MLFVDNHAITDPRVNLAIEEHLLRNVDLEDPILLFYVNEPAVIIGRNQNTLEEIDTAYVKQKGIHVVRRLSGGGSFCSSSSGFDHSLMRNSKKPPCRW